MHTPRQQEIIDARNAINLLRYGFWDKEPTYAEVPATWDSYCGQPSAIRAVLKNIFDCQDCDNLGCFLRDVVYVSPPISSQDTLNVIRLTKDRREALREELSTTLKSVDKLINYYKVNYAFAIDEYVKNLIVIKKRLNGSDIIRMREARKLLAGFDGNDLNFNVARDKIGYSVTLERINELITGYKAEPPSL
jgi:hypothetical protein